VVDEIDVVVMPFGAILAYPIVPKSYLLSKWSNQKWRCHDKLKFKKWMDHYTYVTNLTCSQTQVILCIQFSFILKFKGSIKKHGV
jgi:hypothetical protein